MRSFASIKSPKRIESFQRPIVDTLPFLVGASVESPSVAPADPEFSELPFEQKLALCQMAKRVKVNAVYHAMRKKMADEGSQVPPFTLSTFDALREQGLAERIEGERYHSLTARGSKVADLVAMTLMREHSLHYSWIGGTDGYNKSVHCVCGWHRVVTSGRNEQTRAAAAYTQHMATVRGMDGLAKALTKRGAKTET